MDRPYLEQPNNPIAAYALHEKRHWWFWARRRILWRLVRGLLPPSEGGVILDVGCGPGENINSLVRDYECHGVDTSEEAIAIAKRRHPSVRFTCGLAPENVRETIERADLVMVMDVLEHLDRPKEMLSELVGAVRPGTSLLITVPAGPHLWSSHDVVVGHHCRYTTKTLSELWQDLPVDVIFTSYFMSYLYPAVYVARALNWRCGHSTGTEGTDLKMPSRPVNDILGRIFAAEARILGLLLEDRRKTGFKRGLSLVAVVKRR